jgi:hypothetical protein
VCSEFALFASSGEKPAGAENIATAREPQLSIFFARPENLVCTKHQTPLPGSGVVLLPVAD